jgi:hypothetical protein
VAVVSTFAEVVTVVVAVAAVAALDPIVALLVVENGVVALDDDPQLTVASVMPAKATTQANFEILNRTSNVEGESGITRFDLGGGATHDSLLCHMATSLMTA